MDLNLPPTKEQLDQEAEMLRGLGVLPRLPGEQGTEEQTSEAPSQEATPAPHQPNDK